MAPGGSLEPTHVRHPSGSDGAPSNNEPDASSKNASLLRPGQGNNSFEAREGTQELGTKHNTRLTFDPGFVLPGIQRGTPTFASGKTTLPMPRSTNKQQNRAS